MFTEFVKLPRSIGAVRKTSRCGCDYVSKRIVQLGGDASSMLLDVGSGLGPFVDSFLRFGFKEENIAINEINENFIHFLSSKYQKCHLYKENFLLIDDAVFNYVVSSIPVSFYSHQDKCDYLKKMSLVLKKGGRFFQISYRPFNPFGGILPYQKRRLVLMNFPPLFIYEFSLDLDLD